MKYNRNTRLYCSHTYRPATSVFCFISMLSKRHPRRLLSRLHPLGGRAFCQFFQDRKFLLCNNRNMPRHQQKLNVAQKQQRKKERKAKRAQYKLKKQDREFSVHNLIARPSTIGKPLRVLVLGDGDFSFSASLHRQLRAYQTKTDATKQNAPDRDQKQDQTGETTIEYQLRRKFILVATSYDSREEVVSKYPTTSTAHLRSLGAIGKKRKRRKKNNSSSSSSSGATAAPIPASTSTKEVIKMTSGVVGALCLHNVDATHLVDSLAAHSKFSTSSLPKVYDRIIWNFPHTGEQRVHLNRNIIRDFMDVASTCLSTNGVVYVTLNWKPPYSLWDINTLYPTKQLEAIGYLKFDSSSWSGYGHQTTLGRSGGAVPVQEGIDGARTYMFKMASGQKSIETPEALAMDLKKIQDAQERARMKEETSRSGSKRARMEGGLDSSSLSGVQEFVKRNGGDGSNVVQNASEGSGSGKGGEGGEGGGKDGDGDGDGVGWDQVAGTSKGNDWGGSEW